MNKQVKIAALLTILIYVYTKIITYSNINSKVKSKIQRRCMQFDFDINEHSLQVIFFIFFVVFYNLGFYINWLHVNTLGKGICNVTV